MKRRYILFLLVLFIQLVPFAQITNEWTSPNIDYSTSTNFQLFIDLASANPVGEYRIARLGTTAFEVMEGGYSMTPEYTYTFGVNEIGSLASTNYDFTGDDFPEFISYLEFPDGRLGKRLVDITTGSIIVEFAYSGYSVPFWSFQIVDADNDGELEIIIRRDEHPGQTYYQWLSYNTGLSVNSITTPTSNTWQYELLQNFPNPFNSSTSISYSLDSPSEVTLKIFDVAGQVIREFYETHNSAGNYKVLWDGKNNFGKNVSSGTYFYSLESGDYTAAKKMILLK